MELSIISVFLIGYILIAFENGVHINKAATALATGVITWVLFIIFTPEHAAAIPKLREHLGVIAEIVFFLLGAMTIVELIDAHDGFDVITSRITTGNKRLLLWIIGLVTFFLSAVLDNLTTAIVMTSMTRRLMSDRKDRLTFIGIVIIAANAGGVWTPIGDVTTTMLWIAGNISSLKTMTHLFLPSIACLIVPLTVLSFGMRGTVDVPAASRNERVVSPEKYIVFFTGVGVLVLIPVFKALTHLPPYMGILLGLSVLWIITELMHRGKEHDYRTKLSVAKALQRIDSTSILFFLGILIAVASLEATGILHHAADALSSTIKDRNIILFCIGALSAVVDNVPLVAAVISMYPHAVYPMDNVFWQMLAYTAGTGGSMLIIGSAAGVAAMGMEKIDFFWYAKRIGPLAVAGYVAGFIVILAQHAVMQ
ncbi:MAG: sodium:proton antiporter NhaD [Spirochaetes bacterium]|nr:sodium:proton antiporter NhaD [Spirochaetota bacterium]